MHVDPERERRVFVSERVGDPPPQRDRASKELRDRLGALGYSVDTTEVE